MWNSFSAVLNDYECELTGSGGSPAAAMIDRLLSESDAKIEMLAGEVVAMNNDTRNNDTDPNACIPTKRTVSCKKHTLFGRNLGNACSATQKEKFVPECSACQENYLSVWEVSSNLELWNSDKGTIFCRCYSAALEQMESWTRSAVFALTGIFIFEFLFILSMFWLLLLGAQEKKPEQEPGSGSDGEDSGSDVSNESSETPRGIQMAEMQKQLHPQLQQQQMRQSMSQASQVTGMSDANYMLVEVMCPLNAGPGWDILVTGPDGRQAQVSVPDDVQPGMYFQCEI